MEGGKTHVGQMPLQRILLGPYSGHVTQRRDEKVSGVRRTRRDALGELRLRGFGHVVRASACRSMYQASVPDVLYLNTDPFGCAPRPAVLTS